MSNTIAQPSKYAINVFSQTSINLLLKGVLLLAALVVYIPVFSNQFQLDWDDQVIVINNYTAAGLQPQNVLAILTHFYGGQYAPVNQLIYSTIYPLVGYNPFWFHLVSILFHMANVLLVYTLIRALLAGASALGNNAINRIAFITALLMAVHPYLVESVAWVSASKILIYSFFYLIAIRVYLIYIKSKALKYYLLMALMFILSFGAKEQAVTLPICLLLVDYVLKRNFRTKQIWLEKLPLFILSLFFGYITILSQGPAGAGALSKVPHYPFYQNVIFACYAITEYLIKCLIPVNLQHFYFFPNVIGDPVPLRFWIYPIVLIILAVCFFDFWKRKWVLFAVSFFIIHLIFVIHLIPMARHAIVADRYVYLASVGVFFLMAYYFNQLISSNKYRNLTVCLSLIYVMLIGGYTYQYTRRWHDSGTLRGDFKALFDRYREQNYKK
jgi:hypothetical protein